mmetsp:Transcript_1713/g.3441  ORF Transcript_1713/g.3441 Transcript_1713/m.3441 type:complete len:405 (-) Transcript_1713:94-1308(-)
MLVDQPPDAGVYSAVDACSGSQEALQWQCFAEYNPENHRCCVVLRPATLGAAPPPTVDFGRAGGAVHLLVDGAVRFVLPTGAADVGAAQVFRNDDHVVVRFDLRNFFPPGGKDWDAAERRGQLCVISCRGCEAVLGRGLKPFALPSPMWSGEFAVCPECKPFTIELGARPGGVGIAEQEVLLHSGDCTGYRHASGRVSCSGCSAELGQLDGTKASLAAPGRAEACTGVDPSVPALGLRLLKHRLRMHLDSTEAATSSFAPTVDLLHEYSEETAVAQQVKSQLEDASAVTRLFRLTAAEGDGAVSLRVIAPTCHVWELDPRPVAAPVPRAALMAGSARAMKVWWKAGAEEEKARDLPVAQHALASTMQLLESSTERLPPALRDGGLLYPGWRLAYMRLPPPDIYD